MVDGFDTILWVAGISFVVCWFFRLWWVAALVTIALIGMVAQGGGAPFTSLLLFGLVMGIAAFGGAWLGKFLRRRRADPVDPLYERSPPHERAHRE